MLLMQAATVANDGKQIVAHQIKRPDKKPVIIT
jgi:hypothetical protein